MAYPWLTVAQLIAAAAYNRYLNAAREEQAHDAFLRQGLVELQPTPASLEVDFALEFPESVAAVEVAEYVGIKPAPPLPHEPNAAVVGASSGLSASALAQRAPPTGLTMQDAANIAGVVGGFSSAVGAFFSVRAEQEQFKTQALSLTHEETMSAYTARAAEREAQSIIEASQYDIAAYTMEAGAAAGARRATTAGRGIRLGQGSAAEVEAGAELIKQVDIMSIEVNAARGAAAARTSGVNASNRGLMAGVSAENLRRSAGNALLPVGAATTSLMNTVNRLSPYWRRRR